MSAETQSLTLDQFIAAPPAKVWDALTRPELVETWWAKGDIAPVVGHAFTLDMGKWGVQPCTVLEARAPERLVYRFADWTLSWTLVAENGGTRLTLVHAGFDPDNPQHRFAFDAMGKGWRSHVLPGLARVSEA